jgi:prepilin-type N-terminal cleavage/methylation domain-containing protein
MKIKAANKALRQQAGYTLIELSITVAIIAVLVMTGLYGVPRILDTNKVTTATQQIALASANYSKVAMSSTDLSWATVGGNYSSTATAATTLAAVGVFPDEAVLKTTAGIPYGIQHPFGGLIYSKVNTTALAGTMGVGEGYILKLESVPSKNCFALASAFGSTALQIHVDSTATGFIPATDPTVSSTAPVKTAGSQLSNANLATACSTTPNSSKSIYLWYAF